MNLILLNGPPRSGKDTAAKLLLDYFGSVGGSQPIYDVVHEKFSWPLKAAFAGMMNKSVNNFNVDYYEEHKEEIIPELGVSFRQWQIDFSEKFMKHCYGNDVFARLLLGRVDRMKDMGNAYKGPDYIVVSDCGFQIEVDHVIDSQMFKHIHLFRLHREGCSFKGDSRELVYLNRRQMKAGAFADDIFNNSDWKALIKNLAFFITERTGIE